MLFMNFVFYIFSDNFAHVDIFYPELSVEQMIEVPSFELLSLLGEIGGFLGLLLGASVLTVCEVLDRVSLSLLTYVQGRKVNPNAM